MGTKHINSFLRIAVFLCLLGAAGCSASTSLPAATTTPGEQITAPPQASDTPTEAPTQPPTSLPLPPTDTPTPELPTSAPETIAPATAPPSWNGIPILPDASEPIEDGNTYSYTTASSVPQAADYYTKEMAALGWDLLSSGAGETMSQMLIFQKADQNATIAIAPHPVESDHTLVVIVLE